jgi:hypothetical protein
MRSGVRNQGAKLAGLRGPDGIGSLPLGLLELCQ